MSQSRHLRATTRLVMCNALAYITSQSSGTYFARFCHPNWIMLIFLPACQLCYVLLDDADKIVFHLRVTHNCNHQIHH